MGTFKSIECKSILQVVVLLTSVADTWFCVLIKAVSHGTIGYTWHEMSFCLRWEFQEFVILCIGIDYTFWHLL